MAIGGPGLRGGGAGRAIACTVVQQEMGARGVVPRLLGEFGGILDAACTGRKGGHYLVYEHLLLGPLLCRYP